MIQHGCFVGLIIDGGVGGRGGIIDIIREYQVPLINDLS